MIRNDIKPPYFSISNNLALIRMLDERLVTSILIIYDVIIIAYMHSCTWIAAGPKLDTCRRHLARPGNAASGRKRLVVANFWMGWRT